MSNKTLYSRLRLKRDTSSNWTSNNPVLLNGEIVLVDTQNGKLRSKIGDGVKTYTQLPFSDEDIYTEISSVRQYIDTKLLDYISLTATSDFNLTQYVFSCDADPDDWDVTSNTIAAIDSPQITWKCTGSILEFKIMMQNSSTGSLTINDELITLTPNEIIEIGPVLCNKDIIVQANGILVFSDMKCKKLVTVDDELNSSSTQPVQNKIVSAELNNKSPLNHTHNVAGLQDYDLSQHGFVYQNNRWEISGMYPDSQVDLRLFSSGDYISISGSVEIDGSVAINGTTYGNESFSFTGTLTGPITLACGGTYMGGNIYIDTIQTLNPGFMSVSDKNKLDSLYTKGDIDTKLMLKADSENVYKKTEVYTKSESNLKFASASNVYDKTMIDNKLSDLDSAKASVNHTHILAGEMSEGSPIDPLEHSTVTQDSLDDSISTHCGITRHWWKLHDPDMHGGELTSVYPKEMTIEMLFNNGMISIDINGINYAGETAGSTVFNYNDRSTWDPAANYLKYETLPDSFGTNYTHIIFTTTVQSLRYYVSLNDIYFDWYNLAPSNGFMSVSDKNKLDALYTKTQLDTMLANKANTNHTHSNASLDEMLDPTSYVTAGTLSGPQLLTLNSITRQWYRIEPDQDTYSTGYINWSNTSGVDMTIYLYLSGMNPNAVINNVSYNINADPSTFDPNAVYEINQSEMWMSVILPIKAKSISLQADMSTVNFAFVTTAGSAGFMSTDDKEKLNSIETGANKTTVINYLGNSSYPVSSSAVFTKTKTIDASIKNITNDVTESGSFSWLDFPCVISNFDSIASPHIGGAGGASGNYLYGSGTFTFDVKGYTISFSVPNDGSLMSPLTITYNGTTKDYSAPIAFDNVKINTDLVISIPPEGCRFYNMKYSISKTDKLDLEKANKDHSHDIASKKSIYVDYSNLAIVVPGNSEYVTSLNDEYLIYNHPSKQFTLNTSIIPAQTEEKTYDFYALTTDDEPLSTLSIKSMIRDPAVGTMRINVIVTAQFGSTTSTKTYFLAPIGDNPSIRIPKVVDGEWTSNVDPQGSSDVEFPVSLTNITSIRIIWKVGSASASRTDLVFDNVTRNTPTYPSKGLYNNEQYWYYTKASTSLAIDFGTKSFANTTTIINVFDCVLTVTAAVAGVSTTYTLNIDESCTIQANANESVYVTLSSSYYACSICFKTVSTSQECVSGFISGSDLQKLYNVEASIGDIDTALDNIIALQNSYINGGV